MFKAVVQRELSSWNPCRFITTNCYITSVVSHPLRDNGAGKISGKTKLEGLLDPIVFDAIPQDEGEEIRNSKLFC